jgi:hypothetical protein
VQVPELDVCFDIGLCPRIALTSPYVAISHCHMDHVAGLPYYFSQRMFQKIGMAGRGARGSPSQSAMMGVGPVERSARRLRSFPSRPTSRSK